jgi:2,4-dienoyl-CoA reductase-like NADH-dependent reductase (Old Yellow Enzyme family)
VLSPSAIPYSPESLVPKEMTQDDIAKFKQDWVEAVKRALSAGFDVSGSMKRSSAQRY